MALDPVQYTPTTQARPEAYSPEMLKMQREYAKALLAQRPESKNPFYGVWNGLDDMSRTLLGTYQMKQADERERQGLNTRADIDARHLGALGNQAPTAGAGGPGPAAPFTQEPQAGSDPSSGKDSPNRTQVAALDPNFIEKQKKLEGFIPKAQPDYKQISVGYGSKARFPGETLDPDRASARLQDDLHQSSKVVDGLGVPMTKGQREALISLTNNTGSKWTTAGLGEAVKKGDWDSAGQIIKQYNKAGGEVLPGLVNRRQQEASWMSSANPDLTSQMVAAYRDPQKFAQNSPQQNSPQRMPPGALQSDIADYIRERGGRGQTSFDPEDIIKHRMGTMPQYQVDELGRAIRQAPGEIPRVMPQVQPGYFGKFEPQPDMAGAGIRTFIDPKTGDIRRKYEVPEPPTPPGQGPGVGLPKPRTDVAPPIVKPPTAAPTGAVVQAPPVPPTAPPNAPATPPGGILANAPPVTKSGGALMPVPTPPMEEGAVPRGQLAMAGIPTNEILAEATNQVLGKPSKLDKFSQAEKAPDLDKPTTPEEQGAKEALDWADAHPTAPLKMPKIIGPALQSGDIDELANIKSNRKVNEEALTDQIKEEKKEYGKLQASNRDATSQGLKLRPGLKTSLSVLDSPDFHSGPLANDVTYLRGLRSELGQLTKGWAEDATKRGEDPGIYGTIANWANDPENRNATANQIYQKILQGTILQSLRGMLGPNAGQFRVQELKMLEQAFGNPNLTLPANKAVMSMVDKTNDRNILLGQMSAEYARKHGGLDPSFELAIHKFELEHPPYTPKEYAETLRLINSSGPAAGAPPVGAGVLGTPPPVDKPDPLGIRKHL